MRTNLYIFADGYFCYTAGKLSKIEIRNAEKEHGKLVKVKAC